MPIKSWFFHSIVTFQSNQIDIFTIGWLSWSLGVYFYTIDSTNFSVVSSVSVEQCRSPNAMVLFTVMDHDVLTANDFAGEAFLGLSTIPGVTDSNASIDNFHGLKHTELPLMHQKNRSEFDERVLRKIFSFLFDSFSSIFSETANFVTDEGKVKILYVETFTLLKYSILVYIPCYFNILIS